MCDCTGRGQVQCPGGRRSMVRVMDSKPRLGEFKEIERTSVRLSLSYFLEGVVEGSTMW